ncbi:glycosyltransferase [Acetobacter fallax]|uniref:Glycosyltransferase n=1 Tax=Acetobacter fallax TaxID=1737473 RepID=A0ABX0KIE0_9PROT|nr:glycosyltransferase [Acetobacter fallax]NHO34155.1 glycosyltransferase [Acetobacter fallax]NHO37704.1 glycosyltransferase [Acetobacter fallax]
MNMLSPEHNRSTAPQDSDVAILMRTKDRLLLLPRALGSVLLQKFTRWHLYLVNDGGDRDALENLLRVYRPVFGDRLTVIHHEKSQGMEAASNAALRAGKEELVIVHDDDDSWDTDFLLYTVLFLSDSQNARYLGVATDCVVINEVIEDGTVRETDRSVWRRSDGVTDFEKMLYTNAFPPICFLFRRSVTEQIGPFDANLPVLGDWDFNIRLMTEGDIGIVHKALANYHHRRPGGAAIYGNSVIDGVSSHKSQNILLRNRLLRETLHKNPEFLGLIMALLQPAEETREKVEHSERMLADMLGHICHLEHQVNELIVRQHQQINDQSSGHSKIFHLFHVALNDLDQVRIVATWQKKMMMPVYRAWRLILPVRRIVAKIRRRV